LSVPPCTFGIVTAIHELAAPVVAANYLTAQWCAVAGDDDFVLSGAGVWPLLALLASAADETAGTQLAGAIGRPPRSAQQDAIDLIDVLASSASAAAALGLWVRHDIALNPSWSGGLPDGIVGQLSDQAGLDRWAARHTGGLINRFPLTITPDTELALASALVTRTQWRQPFDDWQGWLKRSSIGLQPVAVIDGAVTRVVVEGDGDVDMHLLIGQVSDPACVLSAGLRELCEQASLREGHTLAVGSCAPGLTVTETQATHPGDVLRVELPKFEISTRHNLFDHSELFGLGGVSDPRTEPLPLLSDTPLCVSGAVQDVLARFTATGFEAAALTAFGLALTGGAPHLYRVKSVQVMFDRPFGFIAVHRPSRLAVVAGWVTQTRPAWDT
jgi:serine protease inhibitor